MKPSPLSLGALSIVASELMFASMGASIKAASAGLSPELLVFMRNAVGLLVVLPLLLHHRSTGLRTGVAGLHLLRALMGLSAMYCFFYVLGTLALADAVLLKMTAPLFIPLVAGLWLAEPITRRVLAGVAVGFCGVLLVLEPGGDLTSGSLIGVAGGLFAAGAKVSVRRLGRSEPPLRTVFYFSLFGVLFSALPLLWSWRTPSPREWGLILLVGLFGTAGQLLMTRGYALAPASRIGPFTYFIVVFAALYGWLFWGEGLDPAFLLGAFLIAAGGILALRGRAQQPLP